MTDGPQSSGFTPLSRGVREPGSECSAGLFAGVWRAGVFAGKPGTPGTCSGRPSGRLLLLPFTLYFFCSLTLFSPLASAQSPKAKAVGMHLKCMCRGCDMTAGGCAHPGGSFSGPCDTAKGELKEVDDLLSQGKSDQQIIDAFVAKYGTIIYVEPPKSGFGLVAWLMPVFYALVGLALAVYVVRKWTRGHATVAPAATTASGAPAPDEAFERARAQAARDTED